MELKTRLVLLEDLQEPLLDAIWNIQRCLIIEKTVGHTTKICMNPASVSCFSELEHTVVQDKETHEPLLSANGSKCLVSSESINKDSGIHTNYKERSNDLTCSISTETIFDGNTDDELSQLLDIIYEKSFLLLQQVEDGKNESIGMVIKHNNILNGPNAVQSSVQAENIITKRQLCKFKADHIAIEQKLADVEKTTDSFRKEKRDLQTKLGDAILENERLRKQLQSVWDFKQICSVLDDRRLMNSSFSDIEKTSVRRRYLQYSEKSRQKVIRVLKENNVLELQRELLTYIMENDVLQAKLDQFKPAKLSAWLKIECRLKKELKSTIAELSQAIKIIDEKNLQMSILKNRIKVLEDALYRENQNKNFELNSNDDWHLYEAYNISGKNCVSSPLELSDFSKTQSLPAVVELGTNDKLRENDDAFFQSSSMNEIAVSLNADISSGNNEISFYREKNKIDFLVDITSHHEQNLLQFNDTIHSYFWRPDHTAEFSGLSYCNEKSENRTKELHYFSDFVGETQSENISNDDLCWKSSLEIPLDDLDSICSEFDPLSGTSSCDNFVDSLNLSAPLRPTRKSIHQKTCNTNSTLNLF